jgi:hypothetical protein
MASENGKSEEDSSRSQNASVLKATAMLNAPFKIRLKSFKIVLIIRAAFDWPPAGSWLAFVVSGSQVEAPQKTQMLERAPTS